MYKRTKATLIIIFFSVTTMLGQVLNDYLSKESPYQLSWTKDISLSAGALGLYSLGVNRLRNEDQNAFTVGQFSQRDIEQINIIDRQFAGTWNPRAKNIGKPFVYTSSIAIPISLMALPGNLRARASLALMFYQGYYLTGGFVTLSKAMTNRFRPFTYLSAIQVEDLDTEFRTEFLEDIEGSDIEDSFFSGDAAKTAYGFVFFAKTYSDYFPDSKYRKVVWGISLASIGIQNYYRVRSGKHFPTDVLVGSLVGGGIAYIIPYLHLKKGNAQLRTGGQGISLVYSIR